MKKLLFGATCLAALCALPAQATVYNAGSLGYEDIYTNGPLVFTDNFSDVYNYSLLYDVGTVDFAFNIGNSGSPQSITMHLVGPGIDITQVGTDSVFIHAHQLQGDYTVYVSGQVASGQVGTYYFGIATATQVSEAHVLAPFLLGGALLGMVRRRRTG